MKNYKNDDQKVFRFLTEVCGCEFRGQLPNRALLDELDSVAADCMAAYEPQAGDRELVGFFCYGALEGSAENIEAAKGADGICYIGRDGRAAIGIPAALLVAPSLREYVRVAVVCHELAHLSEDEHNDRFVARMMDHQYSYYRIKAEKMQHGGKR